jgi:hypothetical protein
MALAACLEFGDNNIRKYSKTYLLLDCHYEFDRSYNEFHPDSAVRCQRVEIVVPAPGKEDTTLFEWFNSRGVRSGRIAFYLIDDTTYKSVEKQVLYFEDAICFSLAEEYDLNSSRRRQIRLGIMAEEMVLGNVLLTYKSF